RVEVMPTGGKNGVTLGHLKFSFVDRWKAVQTVYVGRGVFLVRPRRPSGARLALEEVMQHEVCRRYDRDELPSLSPQLLEAIGIQGFFDQ
ncbi:hypothetical protein AB4144_09405, partial [Rhizobiaceae sp. 2RAB30]